MIRPPETDKTLRQLARWSWRQTRGLRGRIVASCVIGVARVAVALAFVWVSKMLVDAATGASEASTKQMVVLSVALAALMLSETLMSLVINWISNMTEARMRCRMRQHFYDMLMASRWSERSRLHSGDLLSRLTEDVRVLSETMCHLLPQLIVLVVQLVAALALLCVLSWPLAVCIAAILPIFMLLSKIYVRRMRRLTAAIRNDEARAQTTMQEGLQHQVVVNSLGAGGYMSGLLRDVQGSFYNLVGERTRFGTFSRAMVRAGFIGGYLTAFLWSVWHLKSGVITFGTMTAFMQLVARIQNPMANIAQYVPSIVTATASADRMMHLESLETEDRSASLPRDIKAPLGVRLRDVCFSYEIDGRADRVLNHANYDFAPGTCTALMGPTGIGKSTTVRLILALITPNEGSVEIYDKHGHSVKASAATRQLMTYVPQGNSLLAGSIRDNLLLADPDATDADMTQALHTAVADFVMELPQGLDTVVGELGTKLSEGQAQRIAIARALLRKGCIMLLDEFNSSLDQTTASTLMQRLLADRPGNTFIMISHRPEVTEYCHQVVHLDKAQQS